MRVIKIFILRMPTATRMEIGTHSLTSKPVFFSPTPTASQPHYRKYILTYIHIFTALVSS